MLVPVISGLILMDLADPHLTRAGWPGRCCRPHGAV